MRGLLTILSLVTLLSAGTHFAQGAVLLDQTDFDPWGAGFFNSESGAPPMGITHHAVNDVTVDVDGFLVESITTYYSGLDPAWGIGITQGYLHIFDKTDTLPITGQDDPTASAMVAMTAAWNADHWVLTATGLAIDLAGGDYWIGITPLAPGGMWGPEIHLSSMTLIGDATASYDPYAMPGPPAWFNFNPGVDASILIEGEPGGAVPTEAVTWGLVKSLYLK